MGEATPALLAGATGATLGGIGGWQYGDELGIGKELGAITGGVGGGILSAALAEMARKKGWV